jgi:hypothetical protein
VGAATFWRQVFRFVAGLIKAQAPKGSTIDDERATGVMWIEIRNPNAAARRAES